MPQLDPQTLFAQVRALEQHRNSRVMVLAASHLELEILPALYQQCLAMGKVDRLDVVLQGRGGVVNAARRIGLLLRQFTGHLGIIVPFHCQSSATILALAADEIIAGELAMFSPIDPHLHGGSGDDTGSTAFSFMDVRMFGAMSEDWFGVGAEEARNQSLSLLCNSIFPPSLTAFYRTTLELRQIGTELIRFQLPDESEEHRARIIEQLMTGYHSHSYAITGAELKTLGLNVVREAEAESIAWRISTILQALVGGGARDSEQDPWVDVLLAGRDAVQLRTRRPDGLAPQWATLDRRA
jgi:hypothetical protein